jgi:hypothetical protein
MGITEADNPVSSVNRLLSTNSVLAIHVVRIRWQNIALARWLGGLRASLAGCDMGNVTADGQFSSSAVLRSLVPRFLSLFSICEVIETIHYPIPVEQRTQIRFIAGGVP